MAERAYFTHTHEELLELQRGLLTVPNGVSIQFNTLGAVVNPDELPDIFEHTMRVKELVISAAGYAIRGTVRSRSEEVEARLEVDITQEPPVAMFSLINEEQ